MKFDETSLLLYAVTDQAWTGRQTLEEQVKEALEGGVTFLQLREKQLEEAAFLEEAFRIKALAAQYKVPFVINDSVEIALRCDADGVHIGQEDMEAGNVRRLLGPDKILGVSAQTVEQAKLAEAKGADYLGVGAVFGTSTKPDAQEVEHSVLKAICQAVSIPVIAIGGITKDNIHLLAGTGIKGVAVVSAIFASSRIQTAVKALRQEAEGIV